MAMIQGKARWVKILGKPVEGYDPGEKNKVWEFEVDLTPETVQYLKDQNVGDKVKTRKDDNTPFIKFSKKAYNADGEATKPIRVVGPDGEDWDRQKLIGNGSVVNVQFFTKEWEFGKKKGTRINVGAVQVWEHEAYEGGEQFPKREVEKKPLAEAEAWNEEAE